MKAVVRVLLGRFPAQVEGKEDWKGENGEELEVEGDFFSGAEGGIHCFSSDKDFKKAGSEEMKRAEKTRKTGK